MVHTVQTSNASAITGPDYDLAVAGEHEEPVLSYFFFTPFPFHITTLRNYNVPHHARSEYCIGLCAENHDHFTILGVDSDGT